MKIVTPKTPVAEEKTFDVKRVVLPAGFGAAAGALSGFLLSALGLGEILGNFSTPTMVVFGALLGAAIGGFNWQRWVLVFAGVLFLLYIVIAYTPIMFGVASSWTRDDPLPPAADAIVVLSASVKSDGALNAEGTERLLTGLELFQQRVAPRLFTTAVETEYPNGVKSSTADQRRLIELAGAVPAWKSLTGVFTTRDEALQSAVELPSEARTVVVVTSPLHTRRACATFEGVGFKVICRAAAERAHVTRHPLGSGDRLASFRAYVYERAGVVKYRMKGWVK